MAVSRSLSGADGQGRAAMCEDYCVQHVSRRSFRLWDVRMISLLSTVTGEWP